MKTIVLMLAALALWQNWDKIERWIDPPQAGNASGEVVLYATQWCGYCAKTRELFAEDGIAYREVNIETDAAGRAQYQALGGRGVPVIDLRGQVIHGYDVRAIRAAY